MLNHRIVRQVLMGIAGCVAVGLVVAVAGVAVMYYQVYFGDTSFLKRSTIVARINEETTIYCLDEKTPVGSFFESAHRRYVPIDEIPDHMINAIVAAEDKNFFSHGGIDYVALVKALYQGMFAGSRFRGASTLTQQTVKNIMNRWERSVARKFREMIAAQQLERMYNKREILEFYLNQFHVAANGNGIGVAAKYFFNKDVKDLTLVEAAFIAGSVKGPSKYNPFLKFTKDSRERAVKEATRRKNYVLDQMLEKGWITKEQYDEGYAQDIPFSRGKFRNAEVSLVQLMRNQLDRPEILEALDMESADELNNAGLKVFTTLDCELQQDAQLAVRRNLSRMETILKGFKPESAENFEPLRDIQVGDFYFGKVDAITGGPKDAEIKLSFGLPSGVIPHDSIVRYAKLLSLSSGRLFEDHVKDILRAIKVGDVLYVEAKDFDVTTNTATLELNKRPAINGGLVAIDKGEVRVVVSGFDTQGFNRAVYAKRMPGSVFKSVTFYGALQLGWSALDTLDNERSVFPYQNRFYYPRPDHGSPYKEVSMIWAGAMSENLASVWLTSRLVDKLNLEQFKQLLGMLDLMPHSGESAPDFHYRVAKATGVQLDNEGVRQFQLGNAINDVIPDLVFAGQENSVRKLRKMWWGNGYIQELQRIYHFKEGDNSESERSMRIEMVRNNYLRMTALAGQLNEDWLKVAEQVSTRGAEEVFKDPGLLAIVQRFRVQQGSTGAPVLGYSTLLEGEAPSSNLMHVLPDEVGGRGLNVLDVNAIWGQDRTLMPVASAGVTLDDVRLAGYLTMGTYKKIQRLVDEHFNTVMQQSEGYDLNRYHQHHDFRIAIGLTYLVELSKAMGVTSKLEPVLSFPLGTNDVSAGEVAKIYQTFVNGKVYKFFKEGPNNQLNFIRRIEDRKGNELYAPERTEETIAPMVYSVQMKEILRRVVTHGTGRRARGELFVSDSVDGVTAEGKKDLRIRVPVFGKTGTTNDYHNAYFAGFIPYPVEAQKPLDPENSYAVTTYVGYDRTESMRRGIFKGTGGMAALPAWVDFGKSLFLRKKYIDFADKLDLNVISKQEWPLKNDPDSQGISVDLPRGSVLRAEEGGDEVFATTDLSKTGENIESEFAVSNSIRTIVRIPVGGGSSAYSPYRLVHPFVTNKTGPQSSSNVTVPDGNTLKTPEGDSSGITRTDKEEDVNQKTEEEEVKELGKRAKDDQPVLDRRQISDTSVDDEEEATPDGRPIPVKKSNSAIQELEGLIDEMLGSGVGKDAEKKNVPEAKPKVPEKEDSDDLW